MLQTTKTIQVDRRSDLTQQEFVNEYRNPGKPVILRGVSKDWPAVTKFSLDYFQENLGEREVVVSGKSYKLGNFIEILKNATKENPAPYPCILNVRRNFPELMADIEPRPTITQPDRTNNPLLPTKYIPGLDRVADIEVFLGGDSGKFPCLHYDVLGVNTFINQLYGEKEFTLFLPEHSKYLYINEDQPFISQIENHHNADLEKYPLFANATPTTVKISAGETLFIPSSWYHTASSLSLTISVQFDQLCQSNWEFFTNECCRTYRKSPLKAKMINTYLTGLGALMTVSEKLAGLQ